jgi:hypothetical protein
LTLLSKLECLTEELITLAREARGYIAERRRREAYVPPLTDEWPIGEPSNGCQHMTVVQRTGGGLRCGDCGEVLP